MLESRVSNKVKDFLAINAILSPFSQVSIKNHSTAAVAVLLLRKVINDITETLDKKQCCLFDTGLSTIVFSQPALEWLQMISQAVVQIEESFKYCK